MMLEHRAGLEFDMGEMRRQFVKNMDKLETTK